MAKAFTKEQIENIINLGLKNISAKLIAEKYNIKITSVYGVLRRNKVKIEPFHKLDNPEIFKIIDSHSKAYFLGLLTADGCNNKESISLGLAITDIDIILQFKNFIKCTNDIKIRKRNNPNHNDLAVLTIYNKTFRDTLEVHGIISNKTHKTCIPKIDEIFYNSFILGYLDGDGSIAWQDNLNKGVVTFTGNGTLIKEIANILKLKNINGFINERFPERNTNILTLNICGNLKLDRLLSWLYKDSPFFIERKYKNYLKIKKWNNRKNPTLV